MPYPHEAIAARNRFAMGLQVEGSRHCREDAPGCGPSGFRGRCIRCGEFPSDGRWVDDEAPGVQYWYCNECLERKGIHNFGKNKLGEFPRAR